MRYREFRPTDGTRDFVDRYWTLEVSGDASAVQRVVPDGRPELILNLGDPFEAFCGGQWRRQPVCFLAGQITGPLLLRPSGPAKVVGVRFLPHGAARLFGNPMHELADRFAPVDELVPTLARELRQGGTVAALDETLARRASTMRQDLLTGEAVRRIVDTRGTCDIANLAGGLGVSCRQLERLFLDRVGLTPKRFCRIQRFQNVFQAIGQTGADWVRVALECGYYDQAHLIRDSKELSGETPAALLAGDELARHFLSHFSKTTMVPGL
jgi:AraC-like DNA-binding protein